MHRRAFMAGAACALPLAAVGTAVATPNKVYHRMGFTDFGDRNKIERWSGSIEHWMTPQGEVWVSRWPSMTDHELYNKVVEAEELIYG